MFPRESVADEDEESGSGQTVYADFDFAMCFLIAGRTIDVGLRWKYGPFKGRSPSSTVQNSALQLPWAPRHPSASMQVWFEGEQFVVLRGIAK